MPEPTITSNVAQVDTLSVGENGLIASGSVAQRLMASGFNPQVLRTLDILRKEEWVAYDTAVVEVARERLVAVADMVNAGLTYPLQNAMGTTILEWERMSDLTDAEVTMSGIAPAQRDRLVFDLQSMPIPIVHKDFQLNIRLLEASRRTGQPLDTTQARVASRIVSEKLDTIVFDGISGLKVTYPSGAAGVVQGYTTATNRNTGSLTADWSVGTTTGENIVSDVIAMMQALINDNMYGPYVLYVPKDYYLRLFDDYKAASDKTIMQRILEMPDISAVRPTKDLTGGATGEVLMRQMSADVADLVTGMQPTLVSWDEHAGFIMNFKVLAIMVPRVRSDYTTQSGIAHYSV